MTGRRSSRSSTKSFPRCRQTHQRSECGVHPVSPGADGLISPSAFSGVLELNCFAATPVVGGLSPQDSEWCTMASPGLPSIIPLTSSFSRIAITPSPETRCRRLRCILLRCLHKWQWRTPLLLPFISVSSQAFFCRRTALNLQLDLDIVPTTPGRNSVHPAYLHPAYIPVDLPLSATYRSPRHGASAAITPAPGISAAAGTLIVRIILRIVFCQLKFPAESLLSPFHSSLSTHGPYRSPQLPCTLGV